MFLSRCLLELSHTAHPGWKSLNFLLPTCSNPICLHLSRYEFTPCSYLGKPQDCLLICSVIPFPPHLPNHKTPLSFVSVFPISCLSVPQTLCRGKPSFTLLLLLDLLLLFPPKESVLQPTDSLVHPHLVGLSLFPESHPEVCLFSESSFIRRTLFVFLVPCCV